MMKNAVPGTPTSEKWLFFGLLLLLAWLPLARGNQDIYAFGSWSWGCIEIAAFALFSYWMLLLYRGKASVRTELANDRTVLLLIGLGAIYPLLQVLPLPVAWVEFLSPATAEIYAYSSGAAPRQYITLSLDVGLTLQTMLLSCAYVALFFLVLTLVKTRVRVRQITYALIIIAFLESIWALIKISYNGTGQRASGTYINSNHFASLLEVGIPLALGLLMAMIKPRGHFPHWRARLKAIVDWLFSENARLVFVLLVMVAALLYSVSRGATFSLIIAILLITSLVVAMRGRRTREARILPLVFMLVVVAVVWLGGSNFLQRLETSGLQSNSRDLIRESTYEMIADFPVFGIGAGNWAYLYPKYKDPQYFTYYFTPHALNDYLELLAEQGIIGFTIMCFAILLALIKMIIALKTRRDPFLRGIVFGCTISIVSLMIHAWGEANFRIPVNAVYFYVVLALGLVTANLRHEP